MPFLELVLRRTWSGAAVQLLAPVLLASQEPADRFREAADSARELRLIVSLSQRTLVAVDGRDTLRAATIGVPKLTPLRYQGRSWSFVLPRGKRTVLRKDSLPVWIPPDWHYYEVAKARGLNVTRLIADRPIVLSDGRRLEVRERRAGVVSDDSSFVPLPLGYEIIFGRTLYIPPIGTLDREIEGELGLYRLDLGDGHSLHGTRYPESVGEAVTHGCIRLRDEDVEWLYRFVPVGTSVYIY